MTQRTIAALLDSLVDYAGLFPPAGLPMSEAIANYARYRDDEQSWALARFVAPAAKLADVATAWSACVPSLRATASEPLRVSALLADIEKDLGAIAEFHAAHAGIVDAVEVKASSPGEVAAIAGTLPKSLTAYVELPLRDDLDELISAVASHGLRAKIRTGGITANAFPAADAIVRFIALCEKHRVAFKATAGLHHPLRCVRPLTYEPDAASGLMHGFVNVFLAATLIHEGGSPSIATDLLLEEDAAAFTVTDDTIRWRDVELRADAIAMTRRDFAISFGSCSFEEPITEIAALGWL